MRAPLVPSILAAAAFASGLGASRALGQESTAAGSATTLLWYTHPADKWENALPRRQRPAGSDGLRQDGRGGDPAQRGHVLVGRPVLDHGARRLRGAARDPPADLRRAAGAGPPPVRPASHGLPRRAAEVPVARQPGPEARRAAARCGDYRHELDLDTAVATTSYTRGRRPLLARGVRDAGRPGRRGAPHRPTRPGRSAFVAQLRGARNQAHSNYATDYFRMDGRGDDGLVRPGQVGGLPRRRRAAPLRGAAAGPTPRRRDARRGRPSRRAPGGRGDAASSPRRRAS